MIKEEEFKKFIDRAKAYIKNDNTLLKNIEKVENEILQKNNIGLYNEIKTKVFIWTLCNFNLNIDGFKYIFGGNFKNVYNSL